MLRASQILLCIFLFGNNAWAQLSETLRSDRPGATDAATAVGQGMAQVQSGVSYFSLEHVTLDVRSEGPNLGLTLRYGIIEKLEFRTSMAWRWETITTQGLEENRGGMALWNFGFRYNILDGHEEGLSLGIQGDLRVQRIGPPEFQIDRPTPRIFALYNFPVLDFLLVSGNLGLVWNDPDRDPVGAFTLNLSKGVGPNTTVFIEAFGNLYIEAEGFNLNAGVGHLLNNDLQLDFVLTYFGASGELQGFGVDAGVSWRFGVNRKS